MVPLLILGLLAGQPADEAVAADPVAIMECRSNIAGYQALAEQAISPAPPVGWTRLAEANPLLIEFRLARPITVFGRATSHVAVGSSALLAMFDGVEAGAVAAPLGVRNDLGGGAKFLGEKVIARKVDEDKSLGSRFTTLTALNVSTVDTHPGTVLVGCSYRVEIEDL